MRTNYLPLLEATNKILSNHYTLCSLNYGNKPNDEFSNFYEETTFLYDNKEIMVIQQVQSFDSINRYTISYYENGKQRNRNIRYIKKCTPVIASASHKQLWVLGSSIGENCQEQKYEMEEKRYEKRKYFKVYEYF